MQERLLRVPLCLYMFAISLVIVAMVNLNMFTTVLAGLVTAMCIFRICEPTRNRDSGITTVEEPPYPARKMSPQVPTQTAPSPSVPRVAETPAIKLLDRVTDPSTTNGRGFRIPSNGGTFVFDVPDETTPAPQPVAPAPASPAKEHSAAIAQFFKRATLAAPSAESTPAEPEPQPEIPASELEQMFMATHAAYLERHPLSKDVLPKISGQPCQPLDAEERQRWENVIAACDESMAVADEMLRACSIDLGLSRSPRPGAESFARETRRMLTQLNAEGHELDQTLGEISAKAERDLHAVHQATHEVMQKDLYDYMPGPFQSIPRVRGCPTLPSQSIPSQLSAGYRAAGHTPRS